MGWGATFLSAIRAGQVPLGFAVETWATADGHIVGQAGVVVSSVPIGGASVILDPAGLEFGSASLSVPEWRYSGSAWRFVLATDDFAAVGQAFRRGTLVRLKAGIASWPWGSWNTIQAGRVQSVTYRRGRLIVEVWDLVASLQSRIDANAGWSDLFYLLPRSTTLGAGYTVGDATLTLADTGWPLRMTGGTGCLIIDTSTPFYLTYTGVSGTSITGVSATGQFGTTAANKVAGTPVSDTAYLYDRPDQIVARMLTSTGDGTNGIYDVLPQSWGWAIPEEMVDHGEIVDIGNAALTVSSGSYRWDVVEDTQQTDAIGWLASLMSTAGIAIVQVQGKLSIRVAQDPAHPSVSPVAHITDADVLTEATGYSDPEVEWWSGEMPQEYAAFTVAGNGAQVSAAATFPASAPVQSTVETADLTDRLWSNVSAVCTSDSARLWPWFHRVGEVVSLWLASCYWAQLVPGDLARLSTRSIRGRLQSTAYGYSDREVLVIDVRPDWRAGAVQVRLLVQPLDDDDEWRG